MDSPLTGEVWNQEIAFQRGNRYLVSADSGKGKSTLLNIIYGIRKDYTGSLLFDDLAANNQTDFNSLRCRNMAYLFQDLRLFGQLTARENIALKPGSLFTNGETEFYAEKLGIASQLDKPCNRLSLGQQQRVAMIRALSQHFDWLLLDEPFSHLDEGNANLVMNLVDEIAQKNNAGIIATSLGSTLGFEKFNVIRL
jgi:ABC-type lipoprotein export system ATPase subunit